MSGRSSLRSAGSARTGVSSMGEQEEEAQVRYYNLEHDDLETEDPNDYAPGGLYPMAIGQRFGDDGRFRTVHKLGSGGFGTVWLCHDSKDNKWRAVKILAAALSNKDDCQEFEAIAFFDQFKPEQLHVHHIVKPLELFWLESPNGTHLALVLPVMGPDLRRTAKYYGHCRSLIKDICFQLVDAMDFLHRNHYCHGDFRAENIMFHLADGVDEMPEAELLALLGQPETVAVVPVYSEYGVGGGVPTELVGSVQMDFGMGIFSTRIGVSDFGLAYRLATPPPEGRPTGIPPTHSAPEDLMGAARPGIPNDIWALGVTMYEVAYACEPFTSDHMFDPAAVVTTIEWSLGPLPKSYRQAWRDIGGHHYGDVDDETRPFTIDLDCPIEREDFESLKRPYGLRPPASMYLSATLAQQAEISTQIEDGVAPSKLPAFKPEPDNYMATNVQCDLDDETRFCDLVMAIFQYDRSQRPTAEVLMRHPWFEDRLFKAHQVRIDECKEITDQLDQEMMDRLEQAESHETNLKGDLKRESAEGERTKRHQPWRWFTGAGAWVLFFLLRALRVRRRGRAPLLPV